MIKKIFFYISKALLAVLLVVLSYKIIPRLSFSELLGKLHNADFFVLFVALTVILWLVFLKIKLSFRQFIALTFLIGLMEIWQSVLRELHIGLIAPYGLPLGKLLSYEPWFLEVVVFAVVVSFLIVKILKTYFKNFSKFDLPDYTKYILFGLSTIIYCVLSLRRHMIFHSFTMDLAGYDQAMYLLSRFQTPVSSIYQFNNLLGDHFEPILAILSIFYRIGLGINGVLVAQALAFSVSVLPIYYIAKKFLKTNLAATFICLGYIFFIGVQDALEFDFHPLVFIVPALAFTLYYIEKKNAWGYIASLVIGFLSKEVFAIYAVFIGIYLIVKRNYKWGIGTVAVGLIWYLVIIKFVIPGLSGHAYVHTGAYHDLGLGAGEILKTMITRPIYTLKVFFTPEDKIVSMSGILGSAGFLSFLSPSSLILMLPMFGEKYLTMDRNANWAMWWHYTVTVAPILFYSAILSIAKLTQRYKSTTIPIILSLAVFISSISIASIYFGKPPYEMPLAKLLTTKFYRNDPHLDIVNKYLKIIPPEACVITQDQIAPHISARKCIYQLKNLEDIPKADYLIFDSAIGHWPFDDDQFNGIVSTYLNNPGYNVLVSDQTLVIMKKIN